MDGIGQPGIRTARTIAAALAGGVVLFWVVAWVLTGGGSVGMAPDAVPSELALWILGATALAGLVGALVFRGRAVEAARSSGRLDHEWSAERANLVQTNLIVAWALLEAPALLGGVFFLLLGEGRMLWIAVPVYALGMLVTLPRAEWFGEGPVHQAQFE